MNRVSLDTKHIREYLPEFKKSKKDRPYEFEQILKLLDIADERMRTVVLLLASTGMRIGAIPGLRLRNIEKVSTDSGLVIYKITVYEGFNQEYTTFCTPECSTAIDNYLKMRSRYGEKLTEDSFLIREQFDVRDQFAISKCKGTKANTLTIKLIDLAVRAGIRQKEVLEGRPHGTIRNDVPIAHGFRKFFTTQLVNADPDVKTELRCEVARLVEEPVQASELERSLAQAEAQFVYRLQTVGGFGGKSDQLNAYNVFLGEPGYFDRDLARYRAVTAEGLADVVGRVFTRPRVTLSVVPLGRSDLAAADSKRAVVQ
jgi:hypothetical protein